MENSVVIVLIGAASTLSALALRMCYLSKCIKIKCCCLEIDREIAGERQIINVDNNQTPMRQSNNI
jgi:hypothetical protein